MHLDYIMKYTALTYRLVLDLYRSSVSQMSADDYSLSTHIFRS